MSILHTCAFAFAMRFVLAWCGWYSRGLPTQGKERSEELISDLYEHALWADDMGQSPVHVAAAAIGRTVRGMPADLAWRWRQTSNLSPDAEASFRLWRADNRMAKLTIALGSAMTTWCLFVLLRVVVSANRGDVTPATSTSALMVAFAFICLCGTLLALRSRTLFIGALWLGVASQLILPFGLYALFPSSATVAWLSSLMWGWQSGTTVLSLALGAFCLASAIWHLPTPKTHQASSLSTDRSHA